MSVTHLIAAAMSATLALLGSAAPAAAHVVVQSTGAGVGALTPGRSWSVVAVLLGLTGAIVGGLALSRSPGPGTRSGRGGVVALVTGLAGTGVGGLVVAAADGGPGTGSGIVGGLLALAVGLTAAVLGGLVLTRSRRAAASADRLTTRQQ
jgi:FtsH-binding integral membrane protein